jgi:hypothetical protein
MKKSVVDSAEDELQCNPLVPDSVTHYMDVNCMLRPDFPFLLSPSLPSLYITTLNSFGPFVVCGYFCGSAK